MYIKIISYLFFIPLLFILQVSLINGLPELFHFNLIISALIIILLVFGRDESLWCSIGLGFMLDLFSIDTFGAFIIALPMLVFLANILLVRFFTNRSLYSFLALIVFSTLFYDLSAWSARIIGNAIFSTNIFFTFADFYTEIIRIFSNSLVAVAAFYAINYISNRLKPVFLLKSQKI